jgi:YbbR domain-containing protein
MIQFLRHIFVEDFWLKLFSFVLAVLIWFIVYLGLENKSPVSPFSPNMDERTFVNLPVVVMCSAEETRSFRVSPKEVEVTIQAEKKTLRTLQPKDIRVMVDLRDIQAAIALRARLEVSTPAGVIQSHVAPEEVQVVFSPRP